MKNRGMKIKKSKNLYRPKKSGLRKAVESAVFAVTVAGIVFVGYTVADTVLNYEPPTPTETPVYTLGGDEPSGAVTTAVEPIPDFSTEPPPPETTLPVAGGLAGAGTAAYLPLNPATVSREELSGYFSAAKAEGYEAVVIELKDDNGRLLYASAIGAVENDRDIIAGTLTAAEIAESATGAGLKAIARINTLKDHIAPAKLSDVTYSGWIDGRPGEGRRWANPFLAGTRTYTAEITAELLDAGFSDVIYANTIFPYFRGNDFAILPSHVTDSATRYVGLGEFAVESSAALGAEDASVLLEMAYSCFADGAPTGTAEVLRNGGEFLTDGGNISGIVLVFTHADFAAASDPGAIQLTSGNHNGRLTAAVRDALSRVREYSGNLTIIPLFDSAGASESLREEIFRAFADNGQSTVIVRG